MKDGSFFLGFGCIYEESVDSRGDDLSEVFCEQGVFEPFSSASLSRSFLFGGAFEDGAPGAVWDCFVGFKQIVSERWVAPPCVVLAWVVFCDGKV